MSYKDAEFVLSIQEKNHRRIRNIRFERDGYEYRVNYEGGFAAYVSIDRRKIGKRNFEHYRGIGAYDCWSAADVMEKVLKAIDGRA